MKMIVFQEKEHFTLGQLLLAIFLHPCPREMAVNLNYFLQSRLYLARVTDSGRQKLSVHIARSPSHWVLSHSHLYRGQPWHWKRDVCPGKCTANYVPSVNISLCVYRTKIQVFPRNLLFENVLSYFSVLLGPLNKKKCPAFFWSLQSLSTRKNLFFP